MLLKFFLRIFSLFVFKIFEKYFTNLLPAFPLLKGFLTFLTFFLNEFEQHFFIALSMFIDLIGQLITFLGVILPNCLSPKFITGTWNEGDSMMPLDEFPITPSTIFNIEK